MVVMFVNFIVFFVVFCMMILLFQDVQDIVEDICFLSGVGEVYVYQKKLNYLWVVVFGWLFIFLFKLNFCYEILIWL